MLTSSLERTESCPSELGAPAELSDPSDSNLGPDRKTDKQYPETKSKYFANRSYSDSEDFKETKRTVRKLPPRKRLPKINRKNRNKKNVNELREYTKAFGDVCTAGGVDVNPDHLQLAIALSKSVSECSETASASQPETKFDRTDNKDNLLSIRKTLEEFGFKVSSSLEKLGRKLPLKRYPVNSNLINFSQEQKEQIVNNKISQILFESVPRSINASHEFHLSSTFLKESQCLDKCCFFKCAQSSGTSDKDSKSEFYIESLVKPTSSKVGCLLRDWSTIPGREKSPERKVETQQFDKSLFQKNHLDTLLSGTFETIFNCYSSLLKISSELNSSNVSNENTLAMDNPQNPLSESSNAKSLSPVRSYSPDIFDDSCNYSIKKPECSESSIVISDSSDDELPNVYVSQQKKPSSKIDSIDLVDCEEGSISYDKANLSNRRSSSNDDVIASIKEISSKSTRESNILNQTSYSDATKNYFEEVNISHGPVYVLDDECVEVEKSVCGFKSGSINSSKSESNQQSQNSINDPDDLFIISDDELDYSISKAPRQNYTNCNNTVQNQDLGITLLDSANHEMVNDGCHTIIDIQQSSFSPLKNATVTSCEKAVVSKLYRSSILDPIFSFNSSENVTTKEISRTSELLMNQEYKNNKVLDLNLADNKESNKKILTDNANESNCKRLLNIDSANENTPIVNKYIIKSENVTPKVDFQSMDSPQIVEELSKYGLKPLKRKRAVQILEHIYEQTHPLADSDVVRNECKKSKLEIEAPIADSVKVVTKPCNGNIDLKSDLYEKDCNSIQIKKIDGDGDWIFPTKAKARFSSCIMTLDIAFHNYVSLRSKLRDAILRYDPIDIEIIHRDLKLSGHYFKPKDLMTFMDKKCITIKVSSKNQERRKQMKL